MLLIYIHRCRNEENAVKIAQQLIQSPEDLGPLSWFEETVKTLAEKAGKEKLLAYYEEVTENK